MVDLRQTKEWGGWLTQTGWKVENVKAEDGSSIQALIRPMPVLPFSFLKLQHFEKAIDWDSLTKIKRKNRVFWSVIEPSAEVQVEDIKKHGYRLSREPYVPTRTRVIELTQSEKTLITEMSENFRRIIKKGSSAKMVMISPDQFYSGWHKWAKSYILPRNQFDAMVAAFRSKAVFAGMEKDGHILSAIMLLFTADTCFYYQTWTSNLGREKSEHVILVWETMKLAKSLRKKFYNFEGIQDSRFPIARWDGFTEFKRRFGGKEVVYPGSFTKWF